MNHSMEKPLTIFLIGYCLALGSMASTPPREIFITTWQRGSNIMDLIAISDGIEDYSLTFGDSTFKNWIHNKADLNGDGRVTLGEAGQFDRLNIWAPEDPNGRLVREISGLHFFWNLVDLRINVVAELEILPQTLSSMTQLEEFLIVYSPRLKKLPDFSGMRNLSWFNVIATSIEKLPDLSSLSGLEVLQVKESNLSEMPDLHQNQNEMLIIFSYSPITKLEPGLLPPLIETLHLSFTSIVELPDLSQFRELTTLICIGVR